MLEIVFTPKILGPPNSVALGVSLFSLMVNPRLRGGQVGQNSPGVESLPGTMNHGGSRRKLLSMSQVLSSIQYICSRKTLD